MGIGSGNLSNRTTPSDVVDAKPTTPPPVIPCPTANLVFPNPGCDNFDSRRAVDVLFTNPPLGGLACSGAGPTQVLRNQDPFAPTDTDGDSLRDFETEITFMQLQGTCQPGTVPFAVRESAIIASGGLIEEQSGAEGGDGPGSAFFPANSFFEADTPLGTLHNNDPLRMECVISEIPPIGCAYVPQVADIDLLDDTDKVVGVLTHGSHEPHAVDSDFDGCSDEQEAGPDQRLGGQRYFLNFWDFYDPNRDRAVSGLDFFAVLVRFGATEGDKSGPITRNDAPLTMPDPGPPAYHPLLDRGSRVPPADPWDTGPPDGAISGLDFLAVLVQFGHSCAAES